MMRADTAATGTGGLRLGAGSVPDRSASHLALWNTTAFVGLRPGGAERRVAVDHRTDDGRLVGTWAGVIEGGVWVSGWSAPFGGIDLCRDHETVGEVMALVDRGVDVARRFGCHRIEVRRKPPHWSSSEPYVEFALHQAGFYAVESDLNFVIDLERDWEPALRKQARRALAAAEALGLTVERLSADDENGWAEAYAVLRRNRVDKGRPMRLSLDYVRSMRDRFSPLVRMLVEREGDRVVAASLVYRVGRGRDVVQYWGDACHDLPVTPMPIVVRASVADARASGATTLDIGISTDHGSPNVGLIQFKRAMGCRTEVRTVVALDL